VKAVTYSKNGIFSGSDTAATIKVEGFVPTRNDESSVATDRVGPGYFSILGIAVRDGREPGFQDKAGTPRVTVVNEAMAHHYFPHLDPVGRRIWMDDPEQKDQPLQIIGVVANAQDQGLRTQARPRFYVPLSQSQDATGDLNFLVRTSTLPESLVATIRKTIKVLDPGIPIVSARALTERIDESISSEILIARLMSFFGVLALVLACIGLYGVMSYTVTRKTKAIGVRMALGARRQDVLLLVLKEAMFLVMMGILVGIPLALACSQLLGSMLFQLKSTDPAAMSVVVLTMIGVALIASYLPARRAMKVDPLLALKEE
jgi:predicted permease